MTDSADRHRTRQSRGQARVCGPGLRRSTAVVLAVLATTLLGACGSTSRHTGLVGYPSYLPKTALNDPGAQPLIGTVARPALTNQGQPVRVETPGWSVLAVVTGPEVPGEGLPYQAPATTCTWTVTLSQSTAPVPISAADFDSIDNFGHIYHPYVVPGTPAPPSVLPTGRRISFELRAAEPVGEGLMRWAPDGTQIIAKWDFVVEND